MTLAAICRVLGKIWLALGGVVIAIGTLATWYFQGWRAFQSLVSPFNLVNYITVVITLGPGVLLITAADELEQGRRKAALKKLALVPVALVLLAGLAFLSLRDRTDRRAASTDNRVREYKVAAARVKNDSAMMLEHKDYWITNTSGPVGKDGIPDVIKLGDLVSVRGRTIKVQHIFVSEFNENMKWGKEVLARKGDVTCIAVETEQDQPGDEIRNRRWIYIKQCEPLTEAVVPPDEGRATSLYAAIAAGKLDEFKTLTAGVDLSREQQSERPSLLIYALMKKQEGIARYLVDRGANVNAGFEGLPPLFVAIMERYIDLARVMINKGADINARTSGKLAGGGTPFFLAVSLSTYNEDEILKLFSTSGPRPDVSVVDPHGRSALVWCIVHHHERVAAWLLDLGANVNTADQEGMTPLQHSVYRGTVTTTRALLRRGARIDVTDQNGATPLMQALAFFRQSPTTDWIDSARVLIEGGANVNAKSRGGHTPLMFAAAVNQSELIDAMIQRGADVNMQNEAGQTALMAAAAQGMTAALDVLLARRANINLRAKDGKTALVLATFRCGNDGARGPEVRPERRGAGSFVHFARSPGHLVSANPGGVTRLAAQPGRGPSGRWRSPRVRPSAASPRPLDSGTAGARDIA